MSETLSTETRQLAHTYFKANIADVYSSQELGIIALECPQSGLYHVMAENLIVEILKENDEPCKPNEVGRIIITDLHNYATPLIRYDIGDYAEAGEPCSCGRGFPTLKKIMGRERNLIVMPDGSRHWPLTGFAQFRKVAPVQQYQFIQESRTNIEVRLVTARPLTGEEEDNLRTIIHKALDFPYALQFTYFDKRIPCNANGKFEEFVCRAL